MLRYNRDLTDTQPIS